MHRMEGDYGNAAYWYRRVGTPSEYSSFYSAVKELDLDSTVSEIQNSSAWDPLEFNGLINNYRSSNEDSLKKVHILEFKYLFDLCLKKAA